jgi:6-phosphogluconolactonase
VEEALAVRRITGLGATRRFYHGLPGVITIRHDVAGVAAAAADLFERAAQDAIAVRSSFCVALAGGSTPLSMYRLLAERARDNDRVGEPRVPPLEFRASIWSSTHVFWGDERHVPPHHRDSNYRMAREALLEHVPIPSAHVHRIEAGRDNPHDVAARYERTLRDVFATAPHDVPVFDLVLLGMGADGHTASLFPGTPLLREERRLVAADHVASLDAWRITMTVPLLAAARLVVFLVTGREKAAIVTDVLGPGERREDYPAAVVASRAAKVGWVLDHAAAAGLALG